MRFSCRFDRTAPITALTFVAISVFGVRGHSQDEADKNIVELLGIWEVVDVEQNGRSTSESSIKRGDVLRLTRDEYIAFNNYNGSVAYKLKVTYNAATTPMQLSCSGKVSGAIADFVGIIEVVDDRLRICSCARSLSRMPKTFDTAVGDGLTLTVYRRRR